MIRDYDKLPRLVRRRLRFNYGYLAFCVVMLVFSAAVIDSTFFVVWWSFSVVVAVLLIRWATIELHQAIANARFQQMLDEWFEREG